MRIKEDLYYTNEHEWVSVDGDLAYLGITDFAQRHLGNIVFVELPETDSVFEAGSVISVIESVKAVADMHTPVSGTVVEVNQDLEETPELLNKEPYEQHIAVLRMSNPDELKNLMNIEEYEAFCTEVE